MIRKLSLLALSILVLGLNGSAYAQNKLSESGYAQLVYNYLNGQQARFNFDSKDLEDLRITNESYSKTTEITHLYLNQTYNGIRIYNAISSVALKSEQVFYYANRFVNQVETKVNTMTPSRTAAAAIYALNNELSLGMSDLSMTVSNGNSYEFIAESISGKPIEAELVYASVNGNLRLAWDIMIYLKDNTHWYSARVDAQTNAIIEVNDLILTCTFDQPHTEDIHKVKHADAFDLVGEQPLMGDTSQYNVFALPAESPNHGPRLLLSDPSDLEASPFGWHDTDGIAGPEHTITRGNNVWAMEDTDGNDGIGYAPDGTDALNFDFPLDFNQPPSGYEDAAITNLFYVNNMMHDIFYNHGFDEVSGNFQETNYTGEGQGNDFVFADAQDGSGINNATFGTPPDGQNPVMNMFLWSPVGDLIDPLTINNGDLQGAYPASGATFGAELPVEPITADLALAVDNNPDIYDACEFLNNGSEIDGKIAVIRRGNCEFGSKAFTAQSAGAIAVIIVNNNPGPTITMSGGLFGGNVNIPVIMINQADGEALIIELQGGATISATLVNNGPYFVDGSFDNGIIAHEYGHGISIRLTGGSSIVGCLNNEEQMGEGWSDWLGLMVTMTSEDTAERIRGVGTFAISEPIDGTGIRPVPYTTNTSVNSFTYGATNNGLSVPHGVGFVWATVLWDLTWAYIDKYGFDPDLYNGNGGNNRIMRLVLDGLRLQPCSPGFVDGRDALLAADMATTGGVDQCMIWEVFAARGLGFEADQGDTDDRSDQIQDFSMPPENDPSLANCSALLSTNIFDISNFSVYPNPTQSEITIATKQGIGEVRLQIVDLNGRVVLNRTAELYDALQLDISNLQSGMYFLTIEGETQSYKHKIIKN